MMAVQKGFNEGKGRDQWNVPRFPDFCLCPFIFFSCIYPDTFYWSCFVTVLQNTALSSSAFFSLNCLLVYQTNIAWKKRCWNASELVC